jgi:pantothenate kinase
MKPLDFPQAVERLCHHARHGDGRVLIALAGVPGSGKSTLADQLAAEVNRKLGPTTMAALGMDGFHLTKATLRQLPNAAEALARRGAPWTFDPAGLAARLTQLRHSAGLVWCAWPDFQHGVGDPVERPNAVPPETRVLLVEGLYLLHRADGWAPVADAFEEHWFLETSLDIAIERLAARHIRSWKVSPEQAAARIASNDRLNAELVLTTRDHADWILDGATIGREIRSTPTP